MIACGASVARRVAAHGPLLRMLAAQLSEKHGLALHERHALHETPEHEPGRLQVVSERLLEDVPAGISLGEVVLLYLG